MIGIEQRVGVGKEIGSVPDAAKAVADAVRVPGEGPGGQERIAEVARQPLAEAEDERVRDSQRQRREAERDADRFGALRHEAPLSLKLEREASAERPPLR